MSFLGIGGTSVTTTYGPEVFGPAAAAAAASANKQAFSYNPPGGINSASGTSAVPVGTGWVTDENTLEKINHLKKKYGSSHPLPLYIQNLFGIKSAGTAAAPTEHDLDGYSRNLITTLFSAELAVHKSVTKATSKLGEGISSAQVNIAADIRGVKDNINQTLQPVSSHIGSTLGTLTNVLRDPLGSAESFSKSISKQLDKTNPGFTDRLEATVKKYKLDNLQHLPSQMMGSLRSLASTADALLALPFSIASDIYNGLMDIVKQISGLLDSVVSGIFDLIFGPKGLLDSLVPIGQLTDFLGAITEVAGMVGSIGGSFSGLSSVTSSIGQLGQYASMGSGMLSNPASLATSFFPQAGAGLAAVRNPQALMSKLVPPSINKQLGQIHKIPGLGLVGNHGYSFGSAMQSIQGGVIQNITGQYAKQMGILGPLLGTSTGKPPLHNPNASHLPAIVPAPTNPKLPVDQHGLRVVRSPQEAPLVLPQLTSSDPLKSTSASPVANLNTPNQPFNYNANKNISLEASQYLNT